MHIDNYEIVTLGNKYEGNNAGALFTNINELPILPVFSDRIK